jgi:hypothetical protein
MTNRERRLRKLEAALTDTSGLVPHTEKWLRHWDRVIFEFMSDPEPKRPNPLFPLAAVRAVRQWDSPESLVGSLPDE